MDKFPKILIVSMPCIYKADHHGVSLRNWFADWPKEKLAQIYSGGENVGEKFCGYTYKLGPQDRRIGDIFFKIKGSPLGEVSRPVMLTQESHRLSKNYSFARLRHWLSETLVNCGIWEILFRPVLSSQLIQWVENFNPDVIYCQGYSLSFSWLPIMLKEKFNLPICFQTGDDWPNRLYVNSNFSSIMRPIVDKAAKNLIQKANVRYSNGFLMSLEYKKRYGVDFVPIMMCSDYQRFNEAHPENFVNKGFKSIIYSGNIGHYRWKSLIDLSIAVDILKDKGVLVEVHAFVPYIPNGVSDKLLRASNIIMHPALKDEDVPKILKGADILFLPETFEDKEADKIHLSISTKAHLYMMAERPILLYGSEKAGVMHYANQEHWGFTVTNQDPQKLANAVIELLRDESLCISLKQNSRETALKNHNTSIVREQFRMGICQVVSN